MKKLLFTFGIVFLFVNVFGELPKTKTIGVDTLIVIRNACKDPSQGGDDLIHHYYMEYKGESLREEGEAEEIIEDGRLRATFKTESYMKYAFLGVIDVELEVEDPDDYLSFASRFLLDPTFPDDPQYPGHSYLSIADVIDSLEEEPEGDAAYGLVDVFSLAYTLNNLAMIVDMLWYYEDGDHQDELADKLDLLANWTYDKIINSQNGAYTYEGVSGDPIKFSTGYNNIRLIVLGALGYAGVVLDSLDYINKVDWELLDRPGHDVEALLDHLSQTSGIYAEGLGYRSMSFLGLSNYFTARKRYHDPGELDHGYINYYDNINLSKMFEESMYLLYPDLSFVPFDDCWKINYGSGIELNPNILNEYLYPPYGMIEYYYQQ
ncbi:MAG: hypothetical protein H8E57_00265, partial [Candidatus Cloacimonetes bacterium]|nr:hypothetical protein [Candidatus Cloacimonadota bacterium]